MGTLGSIFDLARGSLLGDQAALNATANNVANQNTVGYTRQTVAFTAGDSVSLSMGVQVTGTAPAEVTSSRRDRVLEQRVQQETQAAAGSAARSDGLSQIEGVFALSSGAGTAGSTRLGTAFEKFFTSLTALAGGPTDGATRASVLTAGQELTGAFNAAAKGLGQITAGLQAAVGGSVRVVNGLTATIAGLNRAIGAHVGQGSGGGDAGRLEDQRQTAIAELSKYVGLDQVKTEGNGITLTTRGGAVLVEGDQAATLTAVNVGSGVAIKDSAGKDVGATISDGSVGGQLVVLQQDVPSALSALDQLAYNVANAVNAQNAAGMKGTSGTSGAVAGGPLFFSGASAVGAAGALRLVTSDVSALATAASGEGSGGNGNANALAALVNAKDAGGSTFADTLSALVGTVGVTAGAMKEESSADAASLAQITSQRDQLSGVNLDEEAASLSQYQRSYEAAAKVFSIVNLLIGSAINLGTVTAV